MPRPQFLSKKPKYPTYPFNTNTTLAPNNILKPLNYSVNSLYKPHKVKRKFRLEAEHQACIKEAQASRLAIANLKKEIASAPQANTFIIEETCTETTVENFIPHSEQPSYVEVDYNNIDNQVFISSNNFSQESNKSANMIQLALQNNGQALTADKIKHILGNEVPANVEIMFKTSDGSFVTVTDEVLQNLSTKEGLQYQVVDENGQVGEIQELQVLGSASLEKINKLGTQDLPKDLSNHGSDLPSVTNPDDYINTHFLEESQIVFNASGDSPNGVDSVPTSVDNSKNFSSESVFETSENDKDIELLTLNGEELKPSFTENNSTDENVVKVNDFYDFGDNVEDLKPAKCETDQLESSMTITVDDKYKLNDLTSLSPRKTRSSLKFSPDMFFADISTNSTDLSTEEPDQKKICPNRRKKVL